MKSGLQQTRGPQRGGQSYVSQGGPLEPNEILAQSSEPLKPLPLSFRPLDATGSGQLPF